MTTDAMRVYLALDAALGAGDLEAARRCFPPDCEFPNTRDPYQAMWVLQHALFRAPVGTVAALLAAGADPNFATADGFPALLLVLLHRDDPAERHTLLAMLLHHGADPNCHGLNDWTALHVAAGRGDLAVARLLLDAGADPSIRTRIDDLATPADEAEAAGFTELASVLRAAESR